jgi:hypothetical protein
MSLLNNWIPAGVYPCESRGGNDRENGFLLAQE